MIDNLSSFREMIRYISEQYSYRTAFSILGKEKQKCITYKQFYDDVIYTSEMLKISGVPIAIFAENTYEWIVLYFSIAVTGNIVVPMDTTASADIITRQLEYSMCSIILCSDRYFKFLKDIVCVKYSLANFLTFFFYHCFLFFCTTNKPRLCAEQIFSI